MKRTSKAFAGAAVFVLASMVTTAQTPPSGPYKRITQAEYNQAVQSGQAYVVSPIQRADEKQRQQAVLNQASAKLFAIAEMEP